MLSWQILFGFLLDYIIVAEVAEYHELLGDLSHRLPTDALPWTPMRDVDPQTPWWSYEPPSQILDHALIPLGAMSRTACYGLSLRSDTLHRRHSSPSQLHPRNSRSPQISGSCKSPCYSWAQGCWWGNPVGQSNKIRPSKTGAQYYCKQKLSKKRFRLNIRNMHFRTEWLIIGISCLPVALTTGLLTLSRNISRLNLNRKL